MIKYSHHTYHSFLYQEKIHLDINCNNSTHMTTLETWYIFQESHTWWKMQYLWHVDEFVLHHFSALNVSTDSRFKFLMIIYISQLPLLHMINWRLVYLNLDPYILQPHKIWWRWVIFRNCGERSNRRAESLMWTSPLS